MLISSVSRAVAAVAAGVLALGVASPASAASRDGRGRVVSAVRLEEADPAEARAMLGRAGFDSSAVVFGVDLYRLEYRTIDAAGGPTTASGLLALPRSRDRALWTVSFAHGTQSYRPDVPSSLQPDGFVYAPAIAYATAGFAAVAPDYLGLGRGPGTHPWMDVPSETTASLDLLRAARSFVPSTGRRLERQVLVTGFSQGASAALGLARAVEAGADRRFEVAGVAPISGAYEFQRAEIPALFDGRISGKMAVAYTAYLLVAWNRLHHLYRSPAEVFQAPYAERVDALFDGSTPGPEMLAALPDNLSQLLTSRGVDLLRHPNRQFQAALRVSDSVCAGWTPQSPIRLYQAAGDEQAVTDNTAGCRAEFAARKVTVVELGTPDYHGSRHLGSAVAGTADIVRWFGQLAATARPH